MKLIKIASADPTNPTPREDLDGIAEGDADLLNAIPPAVPA